MNLSMTRARAALLLWGLPFTLACQAGEHDAVARVAWPQAYVQECGACHIAYPPRMLPAPSWARLMGGLDKHFGADASLDAPDRQPLSQWLQAHADRRAATTLPPDDRITRTARFERKHRKVEPETWRLPSVRSASNCLACHGGADQGQYSEHALPGPKASATANARPGATRANLEETR